MIVRTTLLSVTAFIGSMTALPSPARAQSEEARRRAFLPQKTELICAMTNSNASTLFVTPRIARDDRIDQWVVFRDNVVKLVREDEALRAKLQAYARHPVYSAASWTGGCTYLAPDENAGPDLTAGASGQLAGVPTAVRSIGDVVPNWRKLTVPAGSAVPAEPKPAANYAITVRNPEAPPASTARKPASSTAKPAPAAKPKPVKKLTPCGGKGQRACTVKRE